MIGSTEPGSIFKWRRGVAFRAITRGLIAVLLWVMLPAESFVDLSVRTQISLAEWWAAIRKETAVDYHCVKKVPLDDGESEREMRRAPERRRATPSRLPDGANRPDEPSASAVAANLEELRVTGKARIPIAE